MGQWLRNQVPHPRDPPIPKEFPEGRSPQWLSEMGTALRQPTFPSNWTGLVECELSTAPHPKGKRPEPDRAQATILLGDKGQLQTLRGKEHRFRSPDSQFHVLPVQLGVSCFTSLGLFPWLYIWE